MFEESGKQTDGSKKHKNLLVEFVSTLEWLVTAFMLAFVFRAFVMEAFRIPTGSMADTLKGAHFRLQCPECGYCYDHGFIPESYGFRSETVPPGAMPVTPYNQPNVQIKCPSCGYFVPPTEKREVYNGDRILVLKCIYQLFEPQRWDVIVFKNPLEPKVSYIKRLIGKPGETLEIVDGDIYIDGKIARKPPKVQEELWSVIYDNDYQPVNSDAQRFNGRQWKQPFGKIEGSKWQVGESQPAVYTLDVPAEEVSVMRYNTSQGNDLLATYSYNSVGFARTAEQCSDLKVRFTVNYGDWEGMIGATLSKYGWVYKGVVGTDGEMVISRRSQSGLEEELGREKAGVSNAAGQVGFSFMNVDHKLVLEFGEKRVEAYMGSDPNGMGQIPRSPGEAAVTIFGSGRLSLSHVALFRDIHYLSFGYGDRTGRGCRGNPFVLNEDEFFVLGDNSPNSQDCRWWSSDGIGNSGKTYRVGVVPRDYLVGKAVFVYWPSGFTIMDKFPLLVAPDFGRLRLIYGGSDRQF
jgi:signal peptidase I